LQLLAQGPLTELAPGREVWLDGGHNPDAGAVIARHFARRAPFHLIIGMLANKSPAALVAPLADKLLSVAAIPTPGHASHPTEAFAPFTPLPIRAFADVERALRALPPEGDVLIAGSLYLAGEVLRLNRQFPD
jgi:dihydrofolate synthase/folylpolyglutamate synthase